MKNSFKLFILFVAAAYPAMALARIAGLSVPFAVAAENGLYIYGSVFVALLALTDYGHGRARRSRELRLPAQRLMPAREAFTSPVVGARPSVRRRSFRAPQLS